QIAGDAATQIPGDDCLTTKRLLVEVFDPGERFDAAEPRSDHRCMAARQRHRADCAGHDHRRPSACAAPPGWTRVSRMPLAFASSRASGVTTARAGISTSVVPVGTDSSVAAVISLALIECGGMTTGAENRLSPAPASRWVP